MKPLVGLGICGGISAYKSIEVCRNLQKLGYEIQPILTPAATTFVTPLTLSTLCGKEVIIDAVKPPKDHLVDHIGVAKEMGCLVIAPATANTIAKLAHGQADNFLTLCALATKAPVIIVPAMNTAMWEHPATQHNIQLLKNYGYIIMPPDSGELACGDIGLGKMPHPDQISDLVESTISQPHPLLQGKKILITAGPTKESFDPVRYLSNNSSGKMGYALARAARNFGMDVTLISGPTHIDPPQQIETINVTTANEMLKAVKSHYVSMDLIIKSAAVCDFHPQIAEQKIKKDGHAWQPKLEPTVDILSWCGDNKQDHQILIGFAAETENIEDNAQKKCASKNCNAVIANRVGVAGSGFRANTNAATMYFSEHPAQDFPLTDKYQLAQDLLQLIAKTYFD